MFSELTAYLYKYQKLNIPGLGMLRIEQAPANLDIASKLIYPPLYKTAFSDKREQSVGGENSFALNQDLKKTVEDILSFIKQKPFHWNGVGKFSWRNNDLTFDPGVITSEGLQPIPAQKVIRQNAQHSVLIGEREMQSDAATEMLNKPVGKRSLVNLIGWMLAGAAALFILFYLYKTNLQTSASGNQIRISNTR